MFDLAQETLVWIPIRWPGLKQDGEGLAVNTEHEIEVQAVLLEADEFRAMFYGTGEDDQPEEPDAELKRFKRMVKNWRKIKSGNASVVMTDDNIRRLLKQPNFGTGFDTSYVKAWAGRLEEREKNSVDSSTAGPEGEGVATEATATKA